MVRVGLDQAQVLDLDAPSASIEGRIMSVTDPG
jgi:hypothetical protein